MAKQEFKPILERLVGPLPKALLRRGEQLRKRQEKFEALGKKLEADVVVWEKSLMEVIPEELKSSAQTGYKIMNDGNFYQLLCGCVECQAQLHEMSLIETVEAMVKADLIPSSQVAAARIQAYGEEREKLRTMMN